MKTVILKNMVLSALLLGSAQTYADGFSCVTDDGALAIHVYNKVNPEDGTRTASTMILSNPTVNAGKKTVATFSALNETLFTAHDSTDGLVYIGNVDLRYNDSGRKGEYLMGTRLGEVDYVRLDVAHNYLQPVQNNTVLQGAVTIVKRDGDLLSSWATCTRYLKSE